MYSSLILALLASFLFFVSTQEAPYTMTGMSENGIPVEGCAAPCFELNCSEVAQSVFDCSSASGWIEFKSNTDECELFLSWIVTPFNYTVFAIDTDGDIDPDSFMDFSTYLTRSIDYGCALLQMWPDTVSFGISRNTILKSKTLSPCYASCPGGYCSIDCPVGQPSYCVCTGGTGGYYPYCKCGQS
jgi:hypothetical protein